MNALHVFWFRRDLRLNDNAGLWEALKAGLPVLCLYIFETRSKNDIQENDRQINFIHETLADLNNKLSKHKSTILVRQGKIKSVWKKLLAEYPIDTVFFNKEYEPELVKRDQEVSRILERHQVKVKPTPDQLIFEPHEILKSDGQAYQVYGAYRKQWEAALSPDKLRSFGSERKLKALWPAQFKLPSLQKLGFSASIQKVKPINFKALINYESTRDLPRKDTTRLGPHVRFGTISIRKLIQKLSPDDHVFLSELIWREFFTQILAHFPVVAQGSFRPVYDGIQWNNDPTLFKKWQQGQTGYPLVDAGMRELNATGYMHNRVRMVTASFLCKHLLINWRWGESYFADKLLDFDLASNNGNWQWVAGTGCDASPYFRVFNPSIQLKKFDKGLEYIKRWVPEYESPSYPKPIVEHEFARNQAINAYKRAREKN